MGRFQQKTERFGESRIHNNTYNKHIHSIEKDALCNQKGRVTSNQPICLTIPPICCEVDAIIIAKPNGHGGLLSWSETVLWKRQDGIRIGLTLKESLIRFLRPL